MLVGQGEFVEWAEDGHCSLSRFIALRDDMKATGCGETETPERSLEGPNTTNPSRHDGSPNWR